MPRAKKPKKGSSKRYKSNCIVCNHPDVKMIEKLILQNHPYTEIANEYDTKFHAASRKNLSRHYLRCMKAPLKEKVDELIKQGEIHVRSSILELLKTFTELDDLIFEVKELEPKSIYEKLKRADSLGKLISQRARLVKTNQSVFQDIRKAQVNSESMDIAKFMLEIKSKYNIPED